MTEREWLQRERGICSVRECDEPIAGYCASHNSAKLCSAHLDEHFAENIRALFGRLGRQCRIQTYPGAGWGVPARS